MYKKSKLLKILLLPILGGFVVFSCSNCTTGDSDNKANEKVLSISAPTLTKTNVLTGLQNPWDIAFASDGIMFFTEKCKGLSVMTPTGQVVSLFGVAPSIAIAADLFCEGQSGMNGLALDPDFETNRMIYLFMSSNLSTNPRMNRVVRITVSSDYTTVGNRLDIVMDIPYKDVGNSWGEAGSHSGGRLRFGPDGYLYITTGDNHNGTLPQDLQRLGGKVLRVTRDGQAAPGNNTPAGGDSRIFTYGHRNVQGLCFHPDSKHVFIAEHGPNHSDEVTMLKAGGNGGWDPKPEAGVTCADNYCGYTSNKPDGTLTPMTDLAKFPEAMKPLLSIDDSQGMGPCGFLAGAKWKGWDRAMVVGIMGGTRLDVLKISDNNILLDRVSASLPAARLRTTVLGPDGNLYISTDEGEIWKVTPTL